MPPGGDSTEKFGGHRAQCVLFKNGAGEQERQLDQNHQHQRAIGIANQGDAREFEDNGNIVWMAHILINPRRDQLVPFFDFHKRAPIRAEIFDGEGSQNNCKRHKSKSQAGKGHVQISNFAIMADG